jgi:hypothetical protein
MSWPPSHPKMTIQRDSSLAQRCGRRRDPGYIGKCRISPDPISLPGWRAVSRQHHFSLQFAFTHRYVHQFNPQCMTYKVIGKNSSALQASISPSRPIGICNVQLRNSHGEDLVGGLRNRTLDDLFVFLREYGRHGDSGGGEDCPG